MFKKLKQKISEEQISGCGSPGGGASGFPQRSSESSGLSPSVHRNRTSLTEQNDDNTSILNREIIHKQNTSNNENEISSSMGMVIAETKRQMHETLELKEEEIAQLHIRIKQVVLQSEELRKQKEKSEKAGKAQEVESELIESHQTETVQLHKKISEKDDDLQRTMKNYEEILETREEEMTKKVNKLKEQLVQLQEDYKKRLAHEESWNGDEAQLAQKTTLVNDSKLKEQEFREQIHTLQDKLKNYEKAVYVTTVKTPYRDGNLCHLDVSVFGEPTEFEYLRKVIFEYMMGRETKTMAKVITSVLKFPPDQAQKILERENTRTLFTSPPVVSSE